VKSMGKRLVATTQDSSEEERMAGFRTWLIWSEEHIKCRLIWSEEHIKCRLYWASDSTPSTGIHWL
jgi:hypothetical protein